MLTLNKILGLIFPGFKTTKNKLIVFILLILLILFNLFLFKLLRESNAKIERQTQNITNLSTNFDKQIKIEKFENGLLKNSIGALSIESSEFKTVNTKLNGELRRLKLKVKNLQSVTNFGTKTVVKIDTLKTSIHKINDSIKKSFKKYKFERADKYLNLTGNINVDKDTTNKQTPFITDLNFNLKDSLIIAPEFQKKRVWLFFKKRVGVKLNIVSKSPYTEIDYAKHYNFVDYRKNK